MVAEHLSQTKRPEHQAEDSSHHVLKVDLSVEDESGAVPEKKGVGTEKRTLRTAEADAALDRSSLAILAHHLGYGTVLLCDLIL